MRPEYTNKFVYKIDRIKLTIFRLFVQGNRKRAGTTLFSFGIYKKSKDSASSDQGNNNITFVYCAYRACSCRVILEEFIIFQTFH